MSTKSGKTKRKERTRKKHRAGLLKRFELENRIFNTGNNKRPTSRTNTQ